MDREATKIRQKRMEICALSAPSLLETIIENMDKFSEPLVLRPPETGLIMVRGRIGGDGKAFNLGDLLVSRAALSIDGYAGFGYALFSDTKHAKLCAILDALAQHPDYQERVTLEIKSLIAIRNEIILKEEAKAMETKVEFFTMVRGDNDD